MLISHNNIVVNKDAIFFVIKNWKNVFSNYNTKLNTILQNSVKFVNLFILVYIFTTFLFLNYDIEKNIIK